MHDNFSNVSVIVPVLNSEKDIGLCIESLINQDYPKDRYEIIIVDNGSVDDTINIINKYEKNIKIFFENKKGSYTARNTGIKNSCGDIIAFTDSDCIASKNWLKGLCNGFVTEDIGCVVGSVNSYPGKTVVEIYSEKNEILSQKTTINSKFLPYGQTANVAFRKQVFEKIGKFDEELISGGDADIAWRMQIQTSYKLVFCQKSIIEHHHRTTLKNLFVQHFKYGLGSTLLYNKYGNIMSYSVGQSLSDWIGLAIIECSKCLKKLIQNQSVYYVFEPFLMFICTLGFRSGRLYGSIKLKLFYI